MSWAAPGGSARPLEGFASPFFAILFIIIINNNNFCLDVNRVGPTVQYAWRKEGIWEKSAVYVLLARRRLRESTVDDANDKFSYLIYVYSLSFLPIAIIEVYGSVH